MTMLTYTLFTDPAPLEASAAGRQSTGTVYLLVANSGNAAFSKITVTVPEGDGAGDLTPKSSAIKAKGECTDIKSGRTRSVAVRAQGSAFQVTEPGGGSISFGPGDYMVLTLANVTVALKPGLAVLGVTEVASRTAGAKRPNPSHTAVALVKAAPKEIPAPSNFRPEKSAVAAGKDIVLLWDGPDDLDYKILLPNGTEETVPAAPTGKQATGKDNKHKWSPGSDATKWATTYTLIARSRGARQQEYFLTTSVHLRNPTFNSVTTSWVGGPNSSDGRISFHTGGLQVHRDGSAELGNVLADNAFVNSVNTGYVQGKNAEDGRIGFHTGGLKVHRDQSEGLGDVTANGAHFGSVSTGWVGGSDSNAGGFTFPYGGVTVWSKLGSSEQGTVFADTADVSGVTTYKVVGKNADGGWITFPPGGMNVHQASARWGVVGALRFGVRSND
ncbi:hypothetical protein [Nonomuraea sp. NPDC050643]|uniref:hypothetical protein n=1 Tax=Nonomuraea sp. NPDC050643 TaxID=3155660 RepID=UPI003410DE40